MDRATIRILLELEAEQDSLTGRALQLEPCDASLAAVAGRAQHEFSGWLGLLSVLETLMSPPPDG